MENRKFGVEYYKTIFDNVDFSIAEHEMIYDEDGNAIDYKYLYANKTFCNTLNVSLDYLIGKRVFEVFPDTEKYWLEEYNKVVKTGKPLSMVRHAAEFESQFAVYAFKTGKDTFVASFKDVTEANNRFTTSEFTKPEYRVSSDISKIGLFEVNRLNLKANVSDSFCDLVGLETISEGFFRNTLLELTHPDDFTKMSNQIRDILRGETSELETEFQLFNRREDEYRWISFFVFAIESDEKGVPYKYSGLVRDIQEEKIKSEELKNNDYLFEQARKVADLTTFIYKTDIAKFDKSLELDEFTGVENLREIDQFRKIIHPEDLKIYDDATNYTLDHAKGKVTVYRIIKDDQIKYVQSSVYAKSNEEGGAGKVFGILKDITEIERSRRTAISAQNSFELIFNSSPAGIFLLNKNYEISMENRTFREMLDSEIAGIRLTSLLGDKHDGVIENLKNDEFSHVEVKHTINGVKKEFIINITKIDEEFRNDYQGTIVDVTEQNLDKKKIDYMASHDVLTDLYNRNYFEEFIDGGDIQYPLGIIMCDIDGLKLINDAFGHIEGDKLLKAFSRELKKLFPLYVVSRIGGDEFTVLVGDATEDDLDEYSEDIKESINNIEDFKIDFGVSVGYSILEDKDSDFARSFNKAENMMYRRKLTERRSRKSNALSTIMQTLHEKTEETLNHCQRVGDYATMLLSDYGHKRVVDLDDIRLLSDVHDIGKIATPGVILNKKTKLTESEYEEIKYHSEAGFKIIKNIIDKDEIAYGVLYHHERYDGTGYPHGLTGENIPLYARILSLADAYDTMIRGRVYQKPISKKAALKDIKENSGTQFDPKLVESFVRLMENEIE